MSPVDLIRLMRPRVVSEFVGLAPMGVCVAVVRINNSIFLVVKMPNG